MKVAIVGFSTEGKSSYQYYSSQDHEITVCDQNTELEVPAGAAKQLGEGYLDDLDRFDLVMRTAGLAPHYILEKNPGIADKITTQVNEFIKASPTQNLIGVTGTKGKGTTSSLIAKMLEASGKSVKLGGNIGIPPFSFISDLSADSWVVLELSSFQLIDLTASPSLAVCLMVVPEHLNWHSDMPEYTTAKQQLFAHQSVNDTAIYFADNDISQQIVSVSHGRKLPYYASPGAVVEDGIIQIAAQDICHTSELKLLGEHNWQNACAAVTTVWQISQDVEAIRSVLTSFKGLPHRLEFVREIEGVKYYDDSFGTTPETAIVAMKAFSQPKIIILGGSDKGARYEDLAQAIVESNVRAVILIGDQADSIQAALNAAGYTNYFSGGDNMTEIVAVASQQSQAGDIVLLSTGCASFGMFKNYKDRAAQFIQAVQAIDSAD